MNNIGNLSTKSRLTGLIVLSVIIHICLFYFLPYGKKQTENPFTISATIIYTNNTITKSNKLKKTTTTTSHQKIEKYLPASKNKISTKEKSLSDKPKKKPINWYTVKHKIKSTISENFYYPRLAIRNGWQGKVMLAFKINHAGDITEHKISRTSGYRILDQAALKSLSKIKHINISKNIQYYNPVNIEFPVIFKLNEG